MQVFFIFLQSCPVTLRWSACQSWRADFRRPITCQHSWQMSGKSSSFRLAAEIGWRRTEQLLLWPGLNTSRSTALILYIHVCKENTNCPFQRWDLIIHLCERVWTFNYIEVKSMCSFLSQYFPACLFFSFILCGIILNTAVKLSENNWSDCWKFKSLSLITTKNNCSLSLSRCIHLARVIFNKHIIFMLVDYPIKCKD